MYSQKLEPLLNLSLNLTSDERRKSGELDAGYDETSGVWELIVRYVGDIEFLKNIGIRIVYLINNYAILYVKTDNIEMITQMEQIIYIEKPKRLYYSVVSGKRATGVDFLINEGYKGKGVFTACIDSGIDFSHPEFRKNDGSTRIFCMWDQSDNRGTAPQGYDFGSVYFSDEINMMLEKGVRTNNDFSGHGTHVAGIMAGNSGIASESEIIVVKLGRARSGGFPLTSEIMMAVNFVINIGVVVNRPIAVNLSIGNNYGSHDGNSLLETFIDTAVDYGRSVMCVGAGNEGDAQIHTSGKLSESSEEVVELEVGEFQTSFSAQIWKEFVDDFSVRIRIPGFYSEELIVSDDVVQSFSLTDMQIKIINGYPSPYSRYQEIYIDFIPDKEEGFVRPGIWRIILTGKKIVVGQYDMWLPAGVGRVKNTRFLRPDPYTTLTIPSTSRKVISVGAYDVTTGRAAIFTGRGYTRLNRSVKPDLVAPGVDIISAMSGGGYTAMSGTSMACPFVTGIAAVLMEKYILSGTDSYLYGEKMKEFLIKNARKLLGQNKVPDEIYGYGGVYVPRRQ